MPKTALDSGTQGSQWSGLVRNMDTVDQPGDSSPDCANAFFFQGKKGLLGPRYGKTYAGLAEQRIVGVYPYRVAGQTGLLVAMADGRTVFLDSYTGAAPGATLLSAGSTTTFNTTITAGPVNIVINQFGQVVNVVFNGGAVGVTKGIVQCVPVFSASDCTIVYNKWSWTFVNGIVTDVTLTANTASCTDDDQV